jgi:tRNA(fMet)-specific endonuclease VapC
MSTHYLLDTNTVSYVLKNHLEVMARLERVPMEDIAISVITEAELRYGLAKAQKRTDVMEKIAAFLVRVDVLPWDSKAAEAYGELRAALERAGQPLGALDTLIAAQALSVGAVLVTADKAFGNVKKLRTENWAVKRRA